MKWFKHSLLIVFSLTSLCLKAQIADEVVFEFQAYPTGLIPGIRLEKDVNEQSRLLLRLGYNWFRHRDLGVHDDERGDGFGGTLGFKRFLKPGRNKWHWAVKTDIWWNDVEWYDDLSNGQRAEGETSITVLQPTAEVGYTFVNNNFVFTPTLSLGVEWNVRTVGEPTGEGLIILAGIMIGKRF